MHEPRAASSLHSDGPDALGKKLLDGSTARGPFTHHFSPVTLRCVAESNFPRLGDGFFRFESRNLVAQRRLRSGTHGTTKIAGQDSLASIHTERTERKSIHDRNMRRRRTRPRY